jgi:hypothetical protein
MACAPPEAPPPSKRIKILGNASELAAQHADRHGLVNHPSKERSLHASEEPAGVAFYANKASSVPLNIAPPVLLVIPEAGIIYESMEGVGPYCIPPMEQDYLVCSG